jgi:hypothetical protein
MEALWIDSTAHSTAKAPFANEIEVQRFVEEYAKKIFGLQVILSTRRGGQRLFLIDVLAVDSENTPFIIECKWDLVNAEAIRQLVRYKKALQANWSLFEERVGKIRGRRVAIERREPCLIAIGYRYEPSILNEAPPVICLTYAYHHLKLTGEFVEQQRPGKVSVQRAHQTLMPLSRHPVVSKKGYIFERLRFLPLELQEAFWTMDGRLRDLKGVTVVYGGKNFVRYRGPLGRFAEAKIWPTSIQWNYLQSGQWKDGRLDSELMVVARDANKIINRLRQAHVVVAQTGSL